MNASTFFMYFVLPFDLSAPNHHPIVSVVRFHPQNGVYEPSEWVKGDLRVGQRPLLSDAKINCVRHLLINVMKGNWRKHRRQKADTSSDKLNESNLGFHIRPLFEKKVLDKISCYRSLACLEKKENIMSPKTTVLQRKLDNGQWNFTLQPLQINISIFGCVRTMLKFKWVEVLNTLLIYGWSVCEFNMRAFDTSSYSMHCKACV